MEPFIFQYLNASIIHTRKCRKIYINSKSYMAYVRESGDHSQNGVDYHQGVQLLANLGLPTLDTGEKRGKRREERERKEERERREERREEREEEVKKRKKKRKKRGKKKKKKEN